MQRERAQTTRCILSWLYINFDNSLNLWKEYFLFGFLFLDLDLGLDFVSGSVWKRFKERCRARRSFVSFPGKGKGSCRKRQAFLRGVACWVSTLRRRVPLEISASVWLATSNPTVRFFFSFFYFSFFFLGYSLNFWYFGCEKRGREGFESLMFQTGLVFWDSVKMKMKTKHNLNLSQIVVVRLGFQ